MGEAGRHQLYLRRLATALAGVLLLASLALRALALWIGQVKPLRTVGVHGMLPGEYASWLFAALFGYNAAVLFGGALLAALARVRSWLGRTSATVLGLLGLVLGPYLFPFLTATDPWAFWICTFVTASASAVMLSLAVAAHVEASGARGWWGWLGRPWLLAAFVAGGAVAMRGYSHLAAVQEHEREQQADRERQAAYRKKEAASAARFHECERAGDWSSFCGGAKALGVSPNGQWLVTAGKELVVWNVVTRRRAWATSNPRPDGRPQSVQVANDGLRVLHFEHQHGAVGIEASGKAVELTSCGGAGERVWSVALAPNGQRAVSVGPRVCVVDLNDVDERVRELPFDCRSGYASFTLDGEVLWVACTHDLHRIELATGKDSLSPAAFVDAGSKRLWYKSLYLSADDSRVLILRGSGTFSCDVDERDARSGVRLATSAIPGCDPSQAGTLLPPVLVVPSIMNDRFTVVDLERHEPSSLEVPGKGARHVAASRDGKVVFVGKHQGDIHEPAPTIQRWVR